MSFGFVTLRLFFYCFFVFVICFASVLFPASGLSSERYAAFVLDAKTGKVLHSENADQLRYPASLTKMMTLYLTFESLQKKKIKESTRVYFSRLAASQCPTKLGIPAGKSISVEEAIHALVTRSANDASVALAELLAGSQKNFAAIMTKKAKILGMKKTIFKNPNGLPDKQQVTTARDMAILGVSLRKNFPQYYGYFSVRSFDFKKTRIHNHNKLLGRIQGVDGIKTGYTRASGFNLVSSVTDGKRRIVAVVMGGKTGRSRDNQMESLIKICMPKATDHYKVDESSKQKESLIAYSITLPAKAPYPLPNPQTGNQDIRIAEKKTIETIILESMTADSSEKFFSYSYAQETPPEQTSSGRAIFHQAVKESTSKKSKKWIIQLDSFPTKKASKATVQKIQRSIALLADAPFQISSSRKKKHRVRFEGFHSRKSASKACNAIKKKKILCSVLENS